MDIQKEAVNLFRTGQGTVGTAAQAAGVALPAVKHVEIKADLGNDDNVYVGHDENVSSSNGFQLDAGERVQIPVDSLAKVYVIGGAASQGYSWVCV